MYAGKVFTPDAFTKPDEKVWFLKTFRGRGKGPSVIVRHTVTEGRDGFRGYVTETFEVSRYVGPIEGMEATPEEVLGALQTQGKSEMLSSIISLAPKQMVGAGADPNFVYEKTDWMDPKPSRPVEVAIRGEDWEAVCTLIELGAIVSEGYRKWIYRSCRVEECGKLAEKLLALLPPHQ